ncbi:MAG: site-specific DNA-methyltransferase [Bacilli bacterium]|nr:site-specific DNA-methyltransferase [Bacilli bacterium]
MNNEIYIGDNLTVMNNSIFEKYIDRIKMIYIDPPYNTQNQKSYSDKASSCEWGKFMKERLESSRKFLKSDGVIFISIDDNEYANLKIICDLVFGKENFVGTFITQQAQRSNAKHINTIHEYILCFAKNKEKLHKFVINRMEIPEDRKMIDKLNHEIKKIIENEGIAVANKKIKDIVKKYCYYYNISWLKNYSNVDENGNIYFSVDLSTPGKPRSVNIPEIGLKLEPLKTRGWSSDNKFIKLYKENRLCFKDGRPYSKHYLYEAEDNVPSMLRFFSRQGTNDLKKMGLDNLFDTPKPVEMLKFLIRISTKNDDIVLDYFAGSGSLAQAVYEVNEEDKKNIKYVLIQLDEEVNPKSDVYKTCIENGIKPTVDEILKYRIEYYLKQNMKEIDFECFKVN